MYTDYNSQNVNNEPVPPVVNDGPTPTNKFFSILWKILLVIIVLVVLFLGLIQFGVISLKSEVVPEAIILSQNEIGIKKGSGYQFVYSVLPENSTNKQVIWESSNPKVVRVNEVSGYAEALKSGTAVITVKTLINEKVSECVVNVGNQNVLSTGININEKNISIGVGYHTTLSYRILPANATEQNVSFSSSDSSVATVNSKGVVTGVKEGSAIITASTNNGSVTDTAYITVYKQGAGTVVEGQSTITEVYPTSIKLNTKNVNLMVGTTNQLVANVNPTNAPSKVTWSSSNASVATVDSNGLVTAKATGTATIVARTVNNITDTCQVTVGNFSLKLKGILITTNYTVLPVGVNRQLLVAFNPSNATNKSITWTSSNPSVATVDSSGIVRPLSPGSTTITATSVDGGFTDTAVIEVTDQGNVVEETKITFPSSEYQIGIGSSVTLTPTISPNNASFKSVEFSSSDTSIATVDQNGVVKGIGVGKATITAVTKRNKLKASVTVNVKNIASKSVKLNSTKTTLDVGGTFTLVPTVTPDNASNKTVTFKSDDPSIATIDQNGIITAVSKGKTTITVTPNGGGSSATCVVTVN